MRKYRGLVLILVITCPAWATTYYVAQKNPQASDDGPGTAEQPWKTVEKAAATLQAGDRVIVHAGTYREFAEPKNSGTPGAPIVYEGAAGEDVVMTGADVITGWQRVEGKNPIYKVPWTADFMVGMDNGKPERHHPYDEEHKRSGRAEQVIVDGKCWDWPQIQLSLADMKPGTFFPDPDHKTLYLWLEKGDDPNIHQIEADTRGMIFGSNPWARPQGFQYVTLRGMTFRYCATFPQRAAVWMLGKSNILEDCTIEWMAGGGGTVGPEDSIMRRCIVRNCGHTGGCANGHNFSNQDCVWEGNCRKPINRGWDAGGVKMAVSHDGEFQRCIFRNNGGPGLWFDIDVANVVVRNCLFTDNEGCGLFVEISRDIYIVNNTFLRNALRGPSWSEGGVTLAESRNCVVANNLVVGNLDGITLREQGPRPLDTADLGNWPFLNVGHVIVGNVSANNKGYQLGLWYDTAWFGRHPADVAKFKTEEAFAEAAKRDRPEGWWDPLQMGLTIDHNMYWVGKGEKGFLYGVTWRVKHKEWAIDDMAGLTKATGYEAHGIVADPGIEEIGPGLIRLSQKGAAWKASVGPREPVVGLPWFTAPPPAK